LNSLGERIKYLRNILSLNQIKFGELIGLASGSMSEIESGKRTPPFEAMLAICKLAAENEVDLAWLLLGETKAGFNDQIIELLHSFNSLSPTGKATAIHQVASLKELFPEMPTANEDGVYIM